MDNIVSIFHHIHHGNGEHKVHHCGGRHVSINEKLDYTIWHCECGKHAIDREVATGHATGESLDPIEVVVRFTEICPHGGWHLESGKLEK